MPGFFALDTTLVIKLFPSTSEEIAFTVPHLRKNGFVRRYFIPILTDNHKYLTVKLSCLPALRFVIVCSPPFVYHFRRSLVLSFVWVYCNLDSTFWGIINEKKERFSGGMAS